MNKSIFLWTAAFILTAASAVYQRVTGPTYPASGSATLQGKQIDYRFDRSHGGPADHTVTLRTGDETIAGDLLWKRFKTGDPWTPVAMKSMDGTLSADLPHQPPAGKLSYRVVLHKGAESLELPADAPVVIRFKGDVPTPILIIHVGLMFTGMLFSTRAGLECFRKEPKLRTLAFWSAGLLTVGGLVLGPIVQHYAFDAFWTGWPFGHDLTDNKTALIALSWIVAAIAVSRNRHPRQWAVAAAVITLLVFVIPHSVWGSEIDYGATQQVTQPVTK